MNHPPVMHPDQYEVYAKLAEENNTDIMTVLARLDCGSHYIKRGPCYSVKLVERTPEEFQEWKNEGVRLAEEQRKRQAELDAQRPYEHKHEFRLRPHVDDDTPDSVVEWCVVTKDNEGHDITVTGGLQEPLAQWMCDVLNREIIGDDYDD